MKSTGKLEKFPRSPGRGQTSRGLQGMISGLGAKETHLERTQVCFLASGEL
jgi:hypothetical protein